MLMALVVFYCEIAIFVILDIAGDLLPDGICFWAELVLLSFAYLLMYLSPICFPIST
jgi:hypothetical protein